MNTNDFYWLNTKWFFVSRNKYIERELHQQCFTDLQLKTLTKDDSIDPNKMIECLKNLIKAQLEFKNVILHITHYYSVLADGTVCQLFTLIFNDVMDNFL